MFWFLFQSSWLFNLLNFLSLLPEMHAVQPGCDGVGCQAADPVYAQSEPERRPQLRAFPASQQRAGRQVPGRRAHPARVPPANQQGSPVFGGKPLTSAVMAAVRSDEVLLHKLN